MRIDPAIVALRRDPASQHRAQAAVEAVRESWRRTSEAAAVLAELHTYGEGADYSDCPALGEVFEELAQGRRFVDTLVGPMLGALARHPLGHVPFRHQASPGLLVLQLAVAGRATLSLLTYYAEPTKTGSEDVAITVCFGDGERRELCLSGEADARVFALRCEEPGRAELQCEPRRIKAGDTFAVSSPGRTKIVDRPRRSMVMLRLARTVECPAPAREYRIADGALVHSAAGDVRESRDEMAAAVLSAMGRADAAPVLAAIAGSPGSDHLRWQALRHALALDAAAGFESLTALATDATDALAAPAGALRASLVERHPQLADWKQPCPAS